MPGLLILLLLAAPVGGTVDDWLARNAAALGLARDEPFAASVTMTVDVEEGGQVFRLEYRARRPDRVRVDVLLPDGGRYAEGCDEHGCWLQQPGGPVEPASPAGAAALRHGVQLPGKLHALGELPALGHAVSLGDASDGERVTLDVRLADGHRKRYLLDPSSALIVASQDERALHPDVDPERRRIESRYTDYRRVQGRLVAHASCDVDLDTGETLACARVRSCAFDQPLEGEALRRPAH